jgi:hypothetical protein
VGDRRPKLHVPRAAEHHLTLIRMITRGRTKLRDEYKPHPASVVWIGAGLEDASIHHDHLANLELSCRERLVKPQAAGLSSPGAAQRVLTIVPLEPLSSRLGLFTPHGRSISDLDDCRNGLRAEASRGRRGDGPPN